MTRIKILLFDTDFEYLEILSALVGIGWAVSLILLPSAYKEIFLLAGIIGMLQLLLVYINRDRNLLIRRLVTLAAIFFWITVSSLCILLSDKLITNPVVSIMLGVGNCWAYVRLSIKHKKCGAKLYG